MIVYFKNSFGQMRNVKIGFAWTALFFGAFVFLFRGLPGKFFLWLLLSICTVGVLAIVLPFIANKITAKAYLQKGYGPSSSNDNAWKYAMAKWNFSPDLLSAASSVNT